MPTQLQTDEGVGGTFLVAFAGTYEKTGDLLLSFVVGAGAAGGALIVLGHLLPPGQ